ncbi:MAG: aminopeptidase P family protein [Muribaculaceae bacterium]|nr:aminopeptidase P family protein [Muribaculaceae bacterium]
MNNTINDRINRLRQVMQAAGVQAVIIPQSDPHQSEYLADHWQARRWMSGFTGSAGTLVVTLDKALLWVDSRYFLQAAQQVADTEIEIMKIGIHDTPTIDDFLAKSLSKGDTVGLNGLLYSTRDYEALKSTLKDAGIKLDISFDPIAEMWTDRPALPASHIIIHKEEYAGLSASEKLKVLRGFMTEKNADAFLISALDEIAWLLNIRSRDVQCNPVTTAYLLVTPNGGVLFVNPDKVTSEAREYLAGLNIKVEPYHSILDYLSHCSFPAVAIDAATTSARIMEILGDKGVRVQSPVPLAKAIKNDIQIEGFRKAMTRDGVALVKGFMEIERRVKEGDNVTELTVAEILTRCRSEQELYFDDSFTTIAGYGPHGAIVHYSATPESDTKIGTDNLLLIDSGAQYFDGTTDITRTIIIGSPSDKQKVDFTTVLRGNINLAMAVFPTGTRGAQLDVLAHLPLWERGLNYLHGTGHGIGHFLNVHEGPHSIRMNDVPTPLAPGMLVSDEPGVYIEGEYGIRCENVILCMPQRSTDMGDFLQFEAITLFPFDRKLVKASIMTDRELNWLNEYHQRVYEALAPHLNDNEKAWLADATAPIIKE